MSGKLFVFECKIYLMAAVEKLNSLLLIGGYGMTMVVLMIRLCRKTQGVRQGNGWGRQQLIIGIKKAKGAYKQMSVIFMW